LEFSCRCFYSNCLKHWESLRRTSLKRRRPKPWKRVELSEKADWSE
jgi:hypothetical protein